MQIVIELNEELYDYMKSLPYNTILETIVLNGTPLPKEHGRLIDENEIKQMIEDAKVENYRSKDFAENIIKFAPTIIEADEESDTDV